MNVNASRKRHQMISVEFDENDSKELSQLVNSDELESAVKKMKCDETLEDANIEISDVNENINVENNLNLDIFESPPTPPLFEPSQSQEINFPKLDMDADTQSASSTSLMENEVSEKKPTSRKMPLRTNFIFNPLDFVDDPEERKLPDLRSNRADPIGYIAPYPRKGEKRTEECKKVYSERMQNEFDSIQETIYRQQRKSLTYIKWAPPIEIPLEERVSSLSLSERINVKRSCTISNEVEILPNEIDDRFEDDSKAAFKVQVDDDDDFVPYHNKKMGNRKKNRGGQKNANKNPNIVGQLLSKPSNNKSNQGKKASILDSDEDCTFDIRDLNLGREKSLPKIYSRGQANKGGPSGSLHNRSVQEDATWGKEDKSSLDSANFKLGLQLSEDDDDLFLPVQNQKRKQRKKNKLPLKKSYPGNKVNFSDYPGGNNDEDDFPELNSSTQKKPLKTYSKSSASSDFGNSVRDLQDDEIKKEDDLPKLISCPMCGQSFTSILIYEHAYDCQGNGDAECATAFKCDNERILECAEQNDETFERPMQNEEISPKGMMNSRISNNSNNEVALSTSIPLKELRIKLIDFRKLPRNIRERPL